MQKIIIYVLFVTITTLSCKQRFESEKFQGKRNNIADIQKDIKDIEMDGVFISNVSWPYIMDEYLVISDYLSPDKLIHLFNKNSFEYITGIANKGKGPGEIVNIGHIATDEMNRKFYVMDHGKQKIFGYDLDSVLVNPSYIPGVKMETNLKQFPLEYMYVNDTLSIGLIMEPIGTSDFKQLIAKWNMRTKEIKPMKYIHPDIEKKRVSFAVSIEQGIYVECYAHHDLMTICSLDGELKYNVYGNKWNSRKTNSVKYYDDVEFCNDRIVVLYSSGEKRIAEDRRTVNYPTNFLIFNTGGDYLKTLETGYSIVNFCYDKKNNRLILHMDDEKRFGYLDLDGIF